MIKSMKIRLLPTQEQEELMLKSIGCSRFAYNWALARNKELYEQGIKYNMNNIMKDFTQLKKQEDFKWLNEISGKVCRESMRNLDIAFKSFFKGKSKYPKFKSKRKSKKSFYVNYERLYFKDNICNIEKIGKVRFKTNYKIPGILKIEDKVKDKTIQYSNPYCSYDGKYWYISFGYEVEENQTTLNQDLSIGIDLGVKELAFCSNGLIFKNINKSREVRRLNKKLKRLQRQVSRKYLMNKQGNTYVKTNNIIKLEKQIKLVYRRLSNIRNNHIHQTTNKIVKCYPYRVVMEDLNIVGMMKNKYLSKAIAEQCLYKFIRQMKYKCEFNGIEFIQVDRFYPSSKTCSNCGEIKKDLKLKDRIYECKNCGLIIDRDFNASLNLANYKLV